MSLQTATCGDDERDDADLAHDGHVKGDVSNGHEDWARNGAAGPQLSDADGMPDGCTKVAYGVDRTLGLWKLGLKERGNLGCGGHSALCEA